MNFTPGRSLAQRMAALTHANEVRVARAALKRLLKANRDLRALEYVLTGRVAELELLDHDGEVLAPPAGYERGATAFDLLVAAQGIGRVKANRLLVQVRASPSKTIGGLTDRQRLELVELLQELRSRRHTADRLHFTSDRRRTHR